MLMQDHQSYEQYVENLIKEHQQTLNEIRGETYMPQESMTSSKIDDAIRQSQKIVQESLKLLEENQTSSHFSSVQQASTSFLQDQEMINYQQPYQQKKEINYQNMPE